MKVKNVTADQVRDVVEFISAELYNNELIFDREPETHGVRVVWVHFTLRTVNGRSTGARRTHTGRRLAKACWHAHRDVMAELFDLYPNAELHTMLASYHDKWDFRAKFPQTGFNNIGSVAQPLAMQNACEC